MTESIAARAWAHEPAQWKESGNTLTFTVEAGTDYWRKTHYGFLRDNGAFRYQQHAGNFEAKVKFAAGYHELYHQAGLMIRIDESHWIKTGIEFVNGRQLVSAVVTREFSDWSVQQPAESPEALWLRLQRFHDTVQVSYSADSQTWRMLRLAYFPPAVPVSIGMFAAAPGKQPFDVTFEQFAVGVLSEPPIED